MQPHSHNPSLYLQEDGTAVILSSVKAGSRRKIVYCEGDETKASLLAVEFEKECLAKQ